MSGGPGVRPAAVPGALPGLTGSCWVSKDQPVSAKMLITRDPEDKGLQTKAEETCADFLASLHSLCSGSGGEAGRVTPG